MKRLDRRLLDQQPPGEGADAVRRGGPPSVFLAALRGDRGGARGVAGPAGGRSGISAGCHLAILACPGHGLPQHGVNSRYRLDLAGRWSRAGHASPCVTGGRRSQRSLRVIWSMPARTLQKISPAQALEKERMVARKPAVHEKGNAWLTFCQAVMYPMSFLLGRKKTVRAQERRDRGRLPAGRQSHLAPGPAVRLGGGPQVRPGAPVHGQGVAVEGSGAGQGAGRFGPDPGRTHRRRCGPARARTGDRGPAQRQGRADLPGGHRHPGPRPLADEAAAGHRVAGAGR